MQTPVHRITRLGVLAARQLFWRTQDEHLLRAGSADNKNVRIARRLALSGVHAMLAAYFAVMAQQWLPVSSGRASTLTLLTPSNDVFGLTWAAAIAGATIGIAAMVVERRALRASATPQPYAR